MVHRTVKGGIVGMLPDVNSALYYALEACHVNGTKGGQGKKGAWKHIRVVLTKYSHCSMCQLIELHVIPK
jgi:hypothetical protein